MSEKVPPCGAPADEQNALAGVVSDWLGEHGGMEFVLFSVRYGLARTILNAGYRQQANREVCTCVDHLPPAGVPYPACPIHRPTDRPDESDKPLRLQDERGGDLVYTWEGMGAVSD